MHFQLLVTHLPISTHIPTSTVWCANEHLATAVPTCLFPLCCKSRKAPCKAAHQLRCLLNVTVSLIIKGKQLLETGLSSLLRFQKVWTGPKGKKHRYNSSFVQNRLCRLLHFSRWRQWLAYNNWQNANNQHFTNRSGEIRSCQQYHKSYLVLLFSLFFSKEFKNFIS